MRVILQNTQALLGDRLMFTPLVRDLKKAHPDWQIDVRSAGPDIWFNNPHLTPLTQADKTFSVGPGDVTRGSKTNGLHITAAFRCSLEKQLGETIAQGPFKPDLHLSPAEKAHRVIDGHYWVINTDCGPMSAKRWPAERFQQLVDAMADVTFVQVGLPDDNKGRLSGPNVIDLIGRTTIRQLFGLVYNAAGCVSLVSSLMHVAAAFDKPCVVIAGGREPPTFERYANHRYIDNVGTLSCCRNQACWHNAMSACEQPEGDYARCMKMIGVDTVERAVRSYYFGGAVEYPGVVEGDPMARVTLARKKPLLRIVTKSVAYGGAERSVVQIARLFDERGYRVEIASAGPRNPEMAAALPAAAAWSNRVSSPCDILLLYASDMVFGFDKPDFDCFGKLQADRRVMALTYKVGKAGETDWTRGWDKYLFLSTTLCEQFKAKVKRQKEKVETQVLAPAVDLEPFLKVRPNYGQAMGGCRRIVRHSSQGDNKYPRDISEIIGKSFAVFFFKPAPSWLNAQRNVDQHLYDDRIESVTQFLGMGNCYWYLLPGGYTDQGPRVIVEAMAAGLPVIAENRDGPADRVTAETGWLIDNHQEAVGIINDLTPEILETKGRAARERAVNEFDPAKWVNAIVGA